LYNWLCDQLADGEYRPRQIEFARLNLSYTVMSKRKLLQLVEEKLVKGWDDPRMPTVSGLRRRGYTPESIRNFADTIGVTKVDGIIDVGLLEFSLREDLNKKAPRVMGVLEPLRLVITNYPEDKEEWMETVNNPEDESMGLREIPFSREVYIEQDDFMEDPPGKYFRLAPGREVRLKSAYIIKCEEVVRDASGRILEVHCSYDPETRSGGPQSDRKVKGTLHWVSAPHAVEAEIRLYDRLFVSEVPDEAPEGEDFRSNLNPDSLKVITAYVEPGLAGSSPGEKFQFQRMGYFCVDPDSTSDKLVFNRTVTLRDSWAKQQNK
jgi:glutaminyl-tRNA synthetase